MCTWCEPNGWRHKTCNICGSGCFGRSAAISISIATDDPDGEFPYTTTELCLECWRLGGMVAAKERNREIRESLGLPPLDL